MKKWYFILYALVIASFVITGIFLAFMPDQVPMHYNVQGEVDRIGSKYENLILPGLVLLTGATFVILAKFYAARKQEANERIYLLSGAAVLVLFNALNVYLLIVAMRIPSTSSGSSASGILQVTSIGLGAILIVLGSFMPKATMNRTFGLRTKWSMKNPRVWAKSQRFGGIATIVCGCLSILCGIFLEGMTAFVLCMIFIVLWSVACFVGSYRICQSDKAD